MATSTTFLTAEQVARRLAIIGESDTDSTGNNSQSIPSGYPNHGGNTLRRRLTTAETNITTLQTSVGASNNTANASGTTLWSRVLNHGTRITTAESSVTTLQNSVGTRPNTTENLWGVVGGIPTSWASPPTSGTTGWGSPTGTVRERILALRDANNIRVLDVSWIAGLPRNGDSVQDSIRRINAGFWEGTSAQWNWSVNRTDISPRFVSNAQSIQLLNHNGTHVASPNADSWVGFQMFRINNGMGMIQLSISIANWQNVTGQSASTNVPNTGSVNGFKWRLTLPVRLDGHIALVSAAPILSNQGEWGWFVNGGYLDGVVGSGATQVSRLTLQLNSIRGVSNFSFNGVNYMQTTVSFLTSTVPHYNR